jgi:hypothetical protein
MTLSAFEKGVALLVAFVVVAVVIVVVPACVVSAQNAKRLQQHKEDAEAARDTAIAAAGLGDDAQKMAIFRRAIQDAASAPPPKKKKEAPLFPIDALFTWVDGNDDKWRATKREVHRKLYGKPHVENPRDPSRVDDGKDELYYSVHLATKFCPWLRRVWILTAKHHRPKWLGLPRDAYGSEGASSTVNGVKVTVVHHDRVFDPTCIPGPTFNSLVIESQIPHIAQLAEHFIMFNDDFFIGQPMTRQHFFKDDGTSVINLKDVTAYITSLQTMWGQFLRNMQAHSRSLGAKQGLLPDHVAAPVRKSVLAAVVRALRKDVCAMGPFRRSPDFPVWYVALNMAKSVPGSSTTVTKYFGTGPGFEAYMATAKLKLPHLFCINQEFTAGCKAILDRALMS